MNNINESNSIFIELKPEEANSINGGKILVDIFHDPNGLFTHIQVSNEKSSFKGIEYLFDHDNVVDGGEWTNYNRSFAMMAGMALRKHGYRLGRFIRRNAGRPGPFRPGPIIR